jgi:hypothetical protein
MYYGVGYRTDVRSDGLDTVVKRFGAGSIKL